MPRVLRDVRVDNIARFSSPRGTSPLFCRCSHPRLVHDDYHSREDGEWELCLHLNGGVACGAQEVCTFCECLQYEQSGASLGVRPHLTLEKAATITCTCVCGCRQLAEKEDSRCAACKADDPKAAEETCAGGQRQQIPRVANIVDALKETVNATAAQTAKVNQFPGEVTRDIQSTKLEQPAVENDRVRSPEEKREASGIKATAPVGILPSVPTEDTVARNTKRVLHNLRECRVVYLFLFVLFTPGVIGVAATIFYLFGGDSAWLVP